MRVHDPAGACQAKAGEESGCQLVPDPSRDRGRPGKMALVIVMDAIPMCRACCAISDGEKGMAATVRMPIAGSRDLAAGGSFLWTPRLTSRQSGMIMLPTISGASGPCQPPHGNLTPQP